MELAGIPNFALPIVELHHVRSNFEATCYAIASRSGRSGLCNPAFGASRKACAASVEPAGGRSRLDNRCGRRP